MSQLPLTHAAAFAAETDAAMLQMAAGMAQGAGAGLDVIMVDEIGMIADAVAEGQRVAYPVLTHAERAMVLGGLGRYGHTPAKAGRDVWRFGLGEILIPVASEHATGVCPIPAAVGRLILEGKRRWG